MALRVGPRGLWNKAGLPTADCWVLTDPADCWSGGPVAGWRMALASFPSAWNNQLRTGADKGNPTV